MNELFNSSNEDNSMKPSSPSHSIDLDRLSDDEIKQLIADGYKLLDSRKREREKQIKEQIRQMATEAGIKVSFSEKIARKARSKPTAKNQ